MVVRFHFNLAKFFFLFFFFNLLKYTANNVGTGGAAHIAKALTVNTTLTVLDLGGD